MSGDFVETSRPVMDWVLRTTWEASLIAALVLIAQHLLRGRVSARWRYNLWLLVVARLLLPAVPGTHYSPFNLVRLPNATPRPAAPQGAPRPPAMPAEPVRVIPIPGPAPKAPGDRPPIYFASRVVPPAPTGARSGHERVALTDGSFDDVGAKPQAAAHAGATIPSGAVPQPNPTDVVNQTPERRAHLPAPAPLSAPARALPQHPHGIPPPAASPSPAATPAPVTAPVVPWHQRINWPVLALLVWVAGAGFVAARLAWVTLRLGVAVRGLRASDDPALAELLKECAAQLRLRRTPRVLEAPDGFGPALVGLLRPRIVLPACVLRGSFQRDELRLILMHELAHMKRWDVAANWLLAVLGVLHWFNPVLALAFRRMRADREMACDELVLSAAAPSVARAYGPTILKLLQTLSRRPALPGAVGVLEGKQSIRRRIAMIARFDRSNRNASPLFGVALSVLAGGVALTGAVRGQQSPSPAGEVRQLAVEPAEHGEGPGAEEAGAAAEAARQQAEAVQDPFAQPGGGAPPEAFPDVPAAADPAAPPGAEPVPTPAAADPAGLPPGAMPGGSSPGLLGLPVEEAPPQGLPLTPGTGFAPPAVVAPDPVAPDPIPPVPGAAGPAAGTPPTAPRGTARRGAAAPAARQTTGPGAANRSRPVGGMGAMSGVPGANAGMAAPAATARQPARPGAAPGLNPYGGSGGGYPAGYGGNPGGYPGGHGGYPGMGAPANPAAPNGSIEDPAGRDANTRAARALARPLPVDFADVALADALAFLAEQANVDVIADWKSLEAAGVDRNATVSLTLKQGAPAEQVLAWVLRAAGGDALGYAIDHGVVVVAPQDRIDRMVITRAYKLGGLTDSGQALEQLVRDTVAPQSWRESGGPAAVRFFNNQLFVTATEPNHRQVERLLGLMEAQNVQPQPAIFPGMPAMPGMYPGPGTPSGGSTPGAAPASTSAAPATVPPAAQ